MLNQKCAAMKKSILILILSSLISIPVYTEIGYMGMYDFDGMPGFYGIIPLKQPMNATFSDVALVNLTDNPEWSWLKFYDANTASSWDLSEYLEFTLTADAGYYLYFTTDYHFQMQIKAQNPAASDSFRVAYSLDGGAYTEIGRGEIATTLANHVLNLPADMTSTDGGNITIRIYLKGLSDPAANIYIDNIELARTIFKTSPPSGTNTPSTNNFYNKWYFGDSAAIEFTGSDIPDVLTNSAMYASEGCATMCDADGNLLFYTNGMNVWDASHNVMPNGSGLLGGFSTTQAAVIIPKPGSTNNYYIFTLDDVGGPDGLRYSEVDMNLNSGKGNVTGTKNIALYDSICEKMTATRHGNGTDYWVVVHEEKSNVFYSYEITSAGVNHTPVTTAVGGVFNFFSCMKLSPNGTKLAGIPNSVSSAHVQVFDFDNMTGKPSNPMDFTDNKYDGCYGLEFSPDNTKLYIATAVDGEIYQFDLTDPDPPSAGILIDDSPALNVNTLQLGPDGKIYIARNRELSLGVINYPNNTGTDCYYVDEQVFLRGKLSRAGLPNNITFGNFTTPVELVSFSAHLSGNDVVIRWVTASEENNDYFTVQKSRDMKIFKTIGTVQGAGNSGISHTYSTRDINVKTTGTIYYRLKQTDFNGMEKIVKTIPVKISAPIIEIMHAGIFPETNRLCISYNATKQDVMYIQLSGLNGNVLLSGSFFAETGCHEKFFDLPDNARGMYILQVYTDNEKCTEKTICIN